MHHLCLMSVVCIATILAPISAGAAIVVALDEASLVERADTVALGTVVHTTVEVGPRGGIVTHARIQVGRALKGSAAGAVLDVLVPGGILPSGRGSRVAGAPSLRSGDVVLGFFEARETHQVPWGLSFGLLRVSGNPASGFRVTRDVRGLSLVGASGGPVSASSVAIVDEPLDQLWRRLEHYRRQPLGVPARDEGGIR